MCPVDVSEQRPGDALDGPTVQCDACESAFQSATSRTVSFLLLDQLRVPLVGCDDHLERFASVCGLTTDQPESLLDHRPAGGISCPSCQLALTNSEQPVIPVQDGAVALLACSAHQTELIDRFRTGLGAEEQLTASLDPIE